ncbi:MAG: twin-arginine translocase TatA/TatE family subunit [Fimbriimonadaceae bacterium]|nr:twin-arginine translocase TatA/TatE family subunit [Fimbriimonadaceae bacterium]
MFTPLLALGLPAGSEWILILLVILLLFGGSKIPQLMRGMGRGVSEFKEGIEEGKRVFDKGLKGEPDDDSVAKH